MKLKFILLFALLLSACEHRAPTPPENGNDTTLPQWPMFRHDVRHTGNVNNHPYEGIVGPSGPTVSVKWAFQKRGPIIGSPAVAQDGTIYFAPARSRADSFFYAINSDGTLKWKNGSFGVTWSSPAIADDGTIYCISRYRGTFAFHQDGSLKWRLDRGTEGDTSPALGPDGTIYWCDYQFLYAMNPDGTIKWQRKGGYDFHHPIVGLDGTIYYNQSNGGTLVAVNPDGSVKWEYADTIGLTFDSAVLDGDGTIYFISSGILYAIDSAGRLKWKIPRIATQVIISVPAITPDHMIIVVDLQYVRAVSPAGKIKWKKRAAGYISAPPLVDAAGNVYVCHEALYGLRDVITCFDSDGTLKWQLQDSPRGTIIGGTPLGPDGTLYFGFGYGGDYNFYAIH